MPTINPILLQIGPLTIHWYGLMYVLTFAISWWALQRSKLPLNPTQKDNLLITLILGIIIGGRLGYILFYNLSYYLQSPLKTVAIWEGGLSFHGGAIGIAIAAWIYLKTHKNRSPLTFFHLSDFIVTIAPIGIFLGRIGNFINSELYGRISPNNQFCLNFPTDPTNCRYPSQLFEALGEGLIIGLILFLAHRHKKFSTHPGRLTGLFLILYGLIRTLLENFRAPDPQIGYLLGGLTLGQILSLMTVIIGVGITLSISQADHQPQQ